MYRDTQLNTQQPKWTHVMMLCSWREQQPEEDKRMHTDTWTRHHGPGEVITAIFWHFWIMTTVLSCRPKYSTWRDEEVKRWRPQEREARVSHTEMDDRCRGISMDVLKLDLRTSTKTVCVCVCLYTCVCVCVAVKVKVGGEGLHCQQ